MVNQDYRGNAPLTITLTNEYLDTSAGWVIEAYPPEHSEGLFTQRKWLVPSQADFPTRVLFDMRLQQVQPRQAIDADITVRSR